MQKRNVKDRKWRCFCPEPENIRDSPNVCPKCGFYPVPVTVGK